MDEQFLGQIEIPAALDLAATFIFALTGAVTGVRRGYDFVGIAALALVSGVGGSLLRDGLFIQAGPPRVVADDRYIAAIACAAVVGALFGRFTDRFQTVLLTGDAAGLGAYTIVGTHLAISAGISPAAAALVGVLNGVGGGLIRDVLVREEPLLFKPGQFYAGAALVGAGTLVAMDELGAARLWAGLAGIAVTIAIRLLSLRFNWRTAAFGSGPDRRGPG